MQIRKMYISVFAALLLFVSVAQAAIENIEIFGETPSAQETDDKRSLANCFSRLDAFLAAAVGYEDFSDYWRDFYIAFRFPMYYADIANVEDHLNKSRYAVVSAFLRCHPGPLKGAIDAYYRSEAELYFLRHFVDASAGTVVSRLDGPERRRFEEDMLDYFILRRFEKSEDEMRALFSGYFDMFAEQYAQRAKQYAGFADDPVWSGLFERVEKLGETLRSLSDLGSEFVNLGKDVLKAPEPLKQKAAEFFNSPGKSLKEAATHALSRFQICPETGHPDDCKTFNNLPEIFSGDSDKQENKAVQYILSQGQPVTFDEVQAYIKQFEQQTNENAVKAEMLARYEILYGQAHGDGVSSMVSRMDELINLIHESQKPLVEVAQCAEEVKGNVCQ